LKTFSGAYEAFSEYIEVKRYLQTHIADVLVYQPRGSAARIRQIQILKDVTWTR
jgi:hypothetical protein